MGGGNENTQMVVSTSQLCSTLGWYGSWGRGRGWLQQASTRGRFDFAKFLIKEGADVNEVRGGESPLHLASTYNHPEIAKLLLGAGAEVDAKNDEGSTPLHVASYHGNAKVVELLIKHNAQHDTKDDKGRTPLFWVVRRSRKARDWEKRKEYIEAARLLIRLGASKDVVDYKGQTLRDQALDAGKKMRKEMGLNW